MKANSLWHVTFVWAYITFWRRQWQPTLVLLPGKSHGQRSLIGCSPWGRKELDATEWLHFHFSLSRIGGGNGNPHQCSCLENPRDGEPGGLPSMGSHRVGQNWSNLAAAAAMKWSEVARSCLTLYDPMDSSLPCSFVHGIFQARILEWAAISFSRGSSQPRDWTQVSHIAGRRFTLWATREALSL